MITSELQKMLTESLFSFDVAKSNEVFIKSETIQNLIK